eukprot:scaffold3823_cov195-Amphora_coffeaeformis.AAC.4
MSLSVDDVAFITEAQWVDAVGEGAVSMSFTLSAEVQKVECPVISTLWSKEDCAWLSESNDVRCNHLDDLVL